MLEWNADGSVRIPAAQKDPRVKHLPPEELAAAQARLCTVAEAPPRPPPKAAVWVKQELKEARTSFCRQLARLHMHRQSRIR